VIHVVWDWNGTLFDDFALNVEAVATSCASVGGPAVSAARYREHYTRPITTFYERLLGRPLRQGEWERLDEQYHQAYRQGLDRCGLVEGAETALHVAAERGWTQSLLSMFLHEDLVTLVERFGLSRWFVRVDGQPAAAPDTKAASLRRHLEALDVVRAVMIGDAEAAATVGIPCILVEHGPHPRSALEATGAPVVSSPVAAVDTAAAVMG
jgi:phosphoglycolate phosphatase-like HAD superfamily hydrolase